MNIRSLKIGDKREVENLFKQLTDKPLNFDPKNLINDSGCHCIVMENKDAIIGFAALIIHQVPTKGYVGRVEDVIIDENYRGKGLGKNLMKELIKTAKKNKIKTINLTSNPSRAAARNLYESLGFQLSDTGVFWMNIAE